MNAFGMQWCIATHKKELEPVGEELHYDLEDGA